MKNWRSVIIIIALVVVVFGFYYYFEIYKNGQISSSTPGQTTNQTGWETRIDEQEPVLIKVTPLELGAGQNPWKFEVTLTTHAGDLDMDIAKVVTLIDDQGNIFQPVSWEGPGPGGHHVSGQLTFKAIIPTPKFIELEINNVGGISKRTFRWDI